MTSARRTALLASAAAAATLSAAPAHALPAGCDADAQCLVEHVLGGSGTATATTAAAPAVPAVAPSVSVAGPQPAIAGAGRRSSVTLRLRVSTRSLLEARPPAGRPVRRRVDPGVHSVRVRLGGRARPGLHRIALTATDAAGRRATATADVIVLASPTRIVRG